LLIYFSPFSLKREQALHIMSDMVAAMANWRRVAVGADVGLKRNELDDIAPAFEHVQMEKTKALLA